VTVTQPAPDASATAAPGSGDFVEVRLPADSSYLSVLRTATAGLAARLDFNLDEIEDLRIAIDEACATLLSQTVDDTDLTCRFELADDTLAIEVSALTRDGALPAEDTFGWMVLSALAGSVEASADADRRVRIRLRKERSGTENG